MKNKGDQADLRSSKRTRYHRHTPQQVHELEAFFKRFPHPDEKQRWELSERLQLDPRQVKFWFQNRRTLFKTQHKRTENSILREENERLRLENLSMKATMRSAFCGSCGGATTVLGDAPLTQQQRLVIRMENDRLKDEIDRVVDLARRFIDRSEIGVAVGGIVGGECLVGTDSSAAAGQETTRSLYLELALAAMDELMKLAEMGGAMWADGGASLNYDEYLRAFPRRTAGTPVGFVEEATRESGRVMVDALSLIESFMDPDQWAEMFSCIVARASTVDLICGGVDGTKNGALVRMNAEVQLLSPLVPLRRFDLLRFCKKHGEGTWAVVDVSADCYDGETTTSDAYMRCRRLPSGCVVEEMSNGYCKVTWVEHVEYDEEQVHQLYRQLLHRGMGFGAKRWVSNLARHCECISTMITPFAINSDHSVAGRRSMLKLAQRMTSKFFDCVCASRTQKWDKLRMESVGKDVRVMTRSSFDSPEEPPGVVLGATTSVWLPLVSPPRLFDFLRDVHLRSKWDVLSSGGPMSEITSIVKGQSPVNCVSLLRANAVSENEGSSMLILQETCMDSSGSLVVYAPVDVPAMQEVIRGDDPSRVALLPSGFAVVPDGSAGSLLTVAFQILVNSLPTAKLTVDSVETVNNLISCTVQKIKSSLQCHGS